MIALSELIGRSITLEAKDRNSPQIATLSAPVLRYGQKPYGQYETEVFNFLLANKELLGIKSVMKFTALRDWALFN